MNHLPRLLLLSMLLLLAACATNPRFDAAGVDRDLTPGRAVAGIEQRQGDSVLWGGTIISAFNREDHTVIEVLAYPLDAEQRPRTTAGSRGRFLIVHPGYLETRDYAPGREITVKGELSKLERGRIGEVDYRYPVVAADDLQLWARQPTRSQQPRVNFGFGIMIGR